MMRRALLTWAAAAFALMAPATCDVLAARAVAVAPPKCTQSPLQNGGFESGSLGPWVEYLRPVPKQANSTLEIVSGGYQSDYALRMEVGYAAQIKQNGISTCEGTNYVVSFAYKVISATPTCALRTTINDSTTDVFGNGISPLLPGDWAIGTTKFHTGLPEPFELRIALICAYEDGAATVLLDDIQIIPISSIASKGCPKTITLPNSGFDDGKLAPWKSEGGDNSPDLTVASPGYQSDYALQMDFAESNFTDYVLFYQFNGTCNGYEYNTSFALNWLNYTGPMGNPNSTCTLSVAVNGCDPPTPAQQNQGRYLASTTPGWTEYSFVCLASANNLGAFFVIMDCELGNHAPIPAFSVLVDNFNFQPLPLLAPSSSQTADQRATTDPGPKARRNHAA